MRKLFGWFVGILGLSAVFILGYYMFFRTGRTSKILLKKGVKSRSFMVKNLTFGGLRSDETDKGFYFSVSGDFTGQVVVGREITYNALKKCVETEPSLKGRLKWVEDNGFVYIPDSTSEFPSFVTFNISCIPLSNEHSLGIKKTIKWSFKPVKYIRTIYPSPGQISIITMFNIPVVDTANFARYVELKDENGNILNYKKIVWDNENREVRISLSVANTNRLSVIYKKGILFDFGLGLQKNIEKRMNIKKITGEMWLTKADLVKNNSLLYVDCFFKASGVPVVHIDTANIRDYIYFEPGVDYKVVVMDNRLFIYPEFQWGKSYRLNIREGFMSKEGYYLKRDYKRTINVPTPAPSLEFVVKGLYLGKSKGVKLPLKLRRAQKLSMDVDWMPPEHVVFFYNSGANSWDFLKYGRRIASDIRLPYENKGNNERIVRLNLNKLSDFSKKGIYRITVSATVSENDYAFTKTTSMMLVISDIALVTKLSDDKLYVWAFDALSFKPLSNINLKLISYNGFLMGKVKTNGDGLGVIALNDNLSPWIVEADGNGMWSFMDLSQNGLEGENFDVSGIESQRPYDAMVYFQRDLVRPGDTVFYNVLIRKRGNFRGVKLPILLKVYSPKGNLLLNITGQTDKSGYYGGSFVTLPTYPTGRYTFNLFIGGKFYTSEFVNVETFVPQKITLSLKVPERVSSSLIPLDISAMYLFGTPCANSPFTVSITGVQKPFVSKEFRAYTFGIPVVRDFGVIYSKDGTLNEKGQAKFKIDSENFIKTKSNPLWANITVGVREDVGGRATEKSISTMLTKSPYYIGIKTDKNDYNEGETVNIKGIILSPADTVVNSVSYVKFTLYRLYYYYSYWYDDEYEGAGLRWDRNRKMIPQMVQDSIKVLNGKFQYSFVYPSDWYDYAVEFSSYNDGIVVRKEVHSSWWWWRDEEKNKSTPPEVLNIAFSKDTADERDEVVARVKLPFDGNILWTLELDTVYRSSWQKAEGKFAEWRFKAPYGVQNVYVSCLLIRKSKSYLFRRAFGVRKLRIRPSRLNLALNIDVPQKTKPRKRLKVVLTADEDFEATVSVVDEGILSITQFRTPDPIEGILKDIELGLSTLETFGTFIPKVTKSGGGMREKEQGPTSFKFFTTVTYFSGLRKSKNKRLILYVPVGSYQGKVRVMVQAFNKNKMASVKKDVIVSDNVIVFVTMPRFLYFKDTLLLPITFMNTTKQKQNIHLKLKGSGIKLGGYPGKMELRAGEKKPVYVKCVAEDDVDSASLSVSAQYGGGIFKDRFCIPVYPNKPYISETKVFPFKFGKNTSVKIDSLFKGFLSRKHVASFYITPNPFFRSLYTARELIGYPYGCVEQTSSKLYALLALKPYLKVIRKDLTPDKRDEYINYGISRLLSMQKWNGAFAFWPGGNFVYKGFSGYATLVLQLSKEAGYYVPEDALRSAYDYLKDNEMDISLSLYALARGGELNKIPGGVDKAENIYRHSSYPPDKMWAILALYESGKRELARKYFDNVLNSRVKKREFWIQYCYVYYDPLFDNALKFYIANKVYPKSNIADSLGVLVDSLIRIDPPYYYSTQEIIWSLLGIADYSAQFNWQFPKAVLKVDGEDLTPKKLNDGLLYFTIKNPKEHKLSLKVSGGDSMYFIVVRNTGFKKSLTSFKEESHNLFVSRQFYTYSGDLVDTLKQKLKPGDLVVMQVGWKSPAYYKNVAIELPVPAGMEIENPRLSKEALPNWTSRYKRFIETPDYVDVKDDKVIIFTGAGPYTTRMYFILLRVNIRGNFFVSPVRAVVMYKPRVYYHSNVKRLKIGD